VRDIRTREMHDIKEMTKLAEVKVNEFKKKIDLLQVNEKNRISYLQ
jgi:hypothetical protein